MSKSSTVIFKQSYKARAAPGTAGLNVRHLAYIATRPGAVYNPGCGFGLWGQLESDAGIRIQTDLQYAKQQVREASADHTLYRAVISAGRKDAQQYGLYDRARWEQLVNDHIGVIAKEMDIKAQDLRWCASMHYAKGHPHVHILYWDSSDRPRPEGIPKNKFPEKAERIRAAFAGDIHREEIRALQQEQREQGAALREQLQAMCRETCPERGLNLTRLAKGDELEGIARQLAELLRTVPGKGSLRYAYLPQAYKAKVNAMIDKCLDVPELRQEVEKYERCTNEISRLYANGETGTAANLEKAREKLYKELGNEVMGIIRDILPEIRALAPEGQTEAQALVRAAAREIAPELESYQKLKELLPPERIPVERMPVQIDGYFEQMNKVVGDVLQDARVRIPLQGYALAATGINIDAKPAPKYTPKPKPAPEGKTAAPDETPREEPKPDKHIVWGKELTENEWDSYQEAYREAKRDLRDALTDQVRADAGWTEEALHTGAANILCGMMRCASQAAYQRRASAVQTRNNLKTRSKDKSREAKKDYWATQTHASEWGDGYDIT